MLLICLIRTVFCKKSNLPIEYQSIYSLTNFAKNLYKFLTYNPKNPQGNSNNNKASNKETSLDMNFSNKATSLDFSIEKDLETSNFLDNNNNQLLNQIKDIINIEKSFITKKIEVSNYLFTLISKKNETNLKNIQKDIKSENKILISHSENEISNNSNNKFIQFTENTILDCNKENSNDNNDEHLIEKNQDFNLQLDGNNNPLIQNNDTASNKLTNNDAKNNNGIYENKPYKQISSSPFIRENKNKTILELFEDFYKQKLSKEKYSFYSTIRFKNIISGAAKGICSYCLVKKPDRTHHCKQCKSCIRKMDHHCMFLATCISYENYKFFILTIFYTIILTYFMLYMLYKGIMFYYHQFPNKFFLFYLSQYFFLISLTALITYFFYIHIQFLIYNSSTIEHVEKIKDQEYNSIKNFYNIGVYKNIVAVMGSFWSWFIPILTERKYNKNGYEYDINYERYCAIKSKKRKIKN